MRTFSQAYRAFVHCVLTGGLAVVCVCAFPVAAHAAVHDWSGSTAIVVTASDPGQISVSAPIALPIALAADGTLRGASVELRNYSTLPVTVSNVRVEERNGACVVSQKQAASSQESDLLHARFTAEGSAPLDASACLGAGRSPSDPDLWSAAAGDSLHIGIEGGFSNPSATFVSTYATAKPVAACVVTWTVEVK